MPHPRYLHTLSYLQSHPCSLHTASTKQSSVSPTFSHILGTYTLPPPYSPLSLLPPATSLLHKHCLRHAIFCLSYLQPHPGSLHTASAIQSSVSPTSSHILAPYTLPPPNSPLSLLPSATSWVLAHCLRHTVLCLSYIQPHPYSINTASAMQSSVSPTSSHILAPYTLPPSYNPLSLLPPVTSLLLKHCLRHTILCLSYLQPHRCSLNTASAIQSSVSPISSHILTHCLRHTVLCLSYLQSHPCSINTASAIQSSVSPTSSHILAPYTLPPPYSPLSLLPPVTSLLRTYCLRHTVPLSLLPPVTSLLLKHCFRHTILCPLLPPVTSLLLKHCFRHTILCLSYFQPHPYTMPPPYSPLSYLQPHPCSLHTASAIQSSVSPTFSHILAPYPLPPPYSPPSLLPPVTSLLLKHCLRHTILCLSYLQPHRCSLHISHTGFAILSSVSPTSSHILALHTLPPPYCPLSLIPPATYWLFTHCTLCLSYLQSHPCSLHTASAIQSSVSPTSSHILAPYTLLPPYSPLSLLPPVTSLLLTHCLRHTVLCLSYLQSHPCSLHTASAIQSSVSPTSSHILVLHTLPPPYNPLSLLPPATSLLLTHCLRHTALCLSYPQPHPSP